MIDNDDDDITEYGLDAKYYNGQRDDLDFVAGMLCWIITIFLILLLCHIFGG